VGKSLHVFNSPCYMRNVFPCYSRSIYLLLMQQGTLPRERGKKLSLKKLKISKECF